MHKLRSRQNLASKFAIPRYNTSRLQRSVKYGGIKIWDSILSEIRNSSFKVFKSTNNANLRFIEDYFHTIRIPDSHLLVYFFFQVKTFLHLSLLYIASVRICNMIFAYNSTLILYSFFSLQVYCFAW